MEPAKPVTPSQTIGPFFHIGLGWAVAKDAGPPGEDEWFVSGTVTDSNADGISDALLEIWQPRPPRSSAASVAEGFQRVFTDKSGRFAFRVRREQSVPSVVHVTVFARGLLRALRTRLYIGMTLEQLSAVEELQHVPAERLATLVPSGTDPQRRTLDWPVRLQGHRETVFFALVHGNDPGF